MAVSAKWVFVGVFGGQTELDFSVMATAMCAAFAVGVHDFFFAGCGAGHFMAPGARAPVRVTAHFVFVGVLHWFLVGV
jgi:hypothetical protein